MGRLSIQSNTGNVSGLLRYNNVQTFVRTILIGSLAYGRTYFNSLVPDLIAIGIIQIIRSLKNVT